MADDYETVGFFYNPNIAPEEEYLHRLAAVQELSVIWHVPIDYGPYAHERFLEAVRGLEAEPEGGQRCKKCFRLRLEAAAEMAKVNNCTLLASTLTIGTNKRANLINSIGREVCLAASAPLRFLAADWKKQDGFRHSVELSRELGLYRQHYCGCEFSLPAESARPSSK